MTNNIKELSIDRTIDINDNSLSLPIFGMAEEGYINQALYISKVNPELSSFGMPRSLTMVKETGDGVVTTSEYVLIDTIKRFKNKK